MKFKNPHKYSSTYIPSPRRHKSSSSPAKHNCNQRIPESISAAARARDHQQENPFAEEKKPDKRVKSPPGIRCQKREENKKEAARKLSDSSQRCVRRVLSREREICRTSENHSAAGRYECIINGKPSVSRYRSLSLPRPCSDVAAPRNDDNIAFIRSFAVSSPA